MSETVAEKGQRLYDAGAVEEQASLPDGTRRFRIAGDTNTYNAMLSPRGDAVCDCEASVDCSHIAAIDLYIGTDGPQSVEVVLGNDLGPVPTSSVAAGSEPLSTDAPSSVSLSSGFTPAATPSLAIHDGNLAQMILSPEDAMRGRAWKVLEMVCATEMVPKAYRGKPDAALGAVLLGADWGLGPIESLQYIDNIDGRTTPSAELRLRLMRRHGHEIVRVRWYNQAGDEFEEDAPEFDPWYVIVEARRHDEQEKHTFRYSIDDAVAQGKGKVKVDPATGEVKHRSQSDRAMPWETSTQDLLWAGVVRRTQRRLAPDSMDRK